MPSGQLAERIRRRLGMNPLILDPGTLIKSMFQLRVRGGRTFTTFRACADEWLALRKTKVVNRAFAEGVVYEYRCGAGDHIVRVDGLDGEVAHVVAAGPGVDGGYRNRCAWCRGRKLITWP